jgi:RimJ/RimL family protein N-acetyltransferase
MILTKGSFRFLKLMPEDLELVRQWRNSPGISQYMEYRGHITPEMQQEWYKSINNYLNLYIVIEHDFRKIGIINAKNINWEESSLEGGIFFWDEEVQNTPVPAITSLLFAELMIRIMRLKIYAHIMKSNDRAIRYNIQLGFELCEGQENVENQQYVLTPENYLEKSAKLRKAFYLLIDKSPYILEIEKDDYDTGIGKMIEDRIQENTASEIRKTDSGKIYLFDLE